MDDKYLPIEFPLTILIEKDENSTVIYIYPMTHLLEGTILYDKPNLMKKAYSQKQAEYIYKITTQLTANNRWPWLMK